MALVKCKQATKQTRSHKSRKESGTGEVRMGFGHRRKINEGEWGVDQNEIYAHVKL